MIVYLEMIVNKIVITVLTLKVKSGELKMTKNLCNATCKHAVNGICTLKVRVWNEQEFNSGFFECTDYKYNGEEEW